MDSEVGTGEQPEAQPIKSKKRPRDDYNKHDDKHDDKQDDKQGCKKSKHHRDHPYPQDVGIRQEYTNVLKRVPRCGLFDFF